MLNIFVLGLDEPNGARLQSLPEASDYRFHQLLTVDELRHGENIPVRELLDKAQAQLETFGGSIDAIIGYWDFPVTLMLPILCSRFGLRSPSLESVLRCEHKYWSRLEQRKVIDEYPRFALVDPADENAAVPPGLSYPVWLKPVKSASSASAYLVTDDEELRWALSAERDQVGRMGEPLDYILSLADVPAHITEAGGQVCLVEEKAVGDQVTVEGYAREGRVEICGVVDSVTYPGSASFLRYQYPSRLPDDAIEWMTNVTERVIKHIGLQDSTFNIEYFWDSAGQDLKLLEINPRHSQSHAELFRLVDGVSNHRCVIDVALEREPVKRRGKGPYAVAAKWFPRLFADGVVRRCPTQREIEAIEKSIPGTTIEVIVENGDRLSDLHDQDSYSYGLANIHIGADDEQELIDKYRRCLNALPFRLTPP